MQTIRNFFWQATGNHLKPALVTDNFGRKSGLYMNAGKTNAVWLGSKRNSVFKYMQHLGTERNPPKCKVLRSWFTNDLDNWGEKENYSEKFADFLIDF